MQTITRRSALMSIGSAAALLAVGATGELLATDVRSTTPSPIPADIAELESSAFRAMLLLVRNEVRDHSPIAETMTLREKRMQAGFTGIANGLRANHSEDVVLAVTGAARERLDVCVSVITRHFEQGAAA